MDVHACGSVYNRYLNLIVCYAISQQSETRPTVLSGVHLPSGARIIIIIITTTKHLYSAIESGDSEVLVAAQVN